MGVAPVGGGGQRAPDPAPPADVLGCHASDPADVELQLLRSHLGPVVARDVVRVAPAPLGEAGGHRHEAHGGALVGVGHDPLLQRRRLRPHGPVPIVRQARHRVVRHRRRQLAVSAEAQQRGAGMAVPQLRQRIASRQGLVQVMQQRSRFGKLVIEPATGAPDSVGQERGDLGHGRGVAQQPVGRL